MAEPQKEMSKAEKYTRVRGITFADINWKYNVGKQLGSGTYGSVVEATNRETGEKVAVKKCQDVFVYPEDGKRVLREIKLLKFFNGHPNILSLKDLPPPPSQDFRDVFFATDCLDADLAKVISSRQPLVEQHWSYFLYQILRGLKYIHSAGVMHRDLKPANLLCNLNCDVKICDFGLSRGVGGDSDNVYTDYVVTRWYRPPELLLMTGKYNASIDIWSTGCILFELISGVPLFQGTQTTDMLQLIIDTIPLSQTDNFSWVPSEEHRAGLDKARGQQQQYGFKRNLAELLKPKFQTASVADNAIDVISRMLTFSPTDRPSAAKLLEHPYFAEMYEPSDAPSCNKEWYWEHESKLLSADRLKAMFWDEFCEWNPSLREPISTTSLLK